MRRRQTSFSSAAFLLLFLLSHGGYSLQEPKRIANINSTYLRKNSRLSTGKHIKATLGERVGDALRLVHTCLLRNEGREVNVNPVHHKEHCTATQCSYTFYPTRSCSSSHPATICSHLRSLDLFIRELA